MRGFEPMACFENGLGSAKLKSSNPKWEGSNLLPVWKMTQREQNLKVRTLNAGVRTFHLWKMAYGEQNLKVWTINDLLPIWKMAQGVLNLKVWTLQARVRIFRLSGNWPRMCKIRSFELSMREFEPLLQFGKWAQVVNWVIGFKLSFMGNLWLWLLLELLVCVQTKGAQPWMISMA